MSVFKMIVVMCLPLLATATLVTIRDCAVGPGAVSVSHEAWQFVGDVLQVSRVCFV